MYRYMLLLECIFVGAFSVAIYLPLSYLLRVPVPEHVVLFILGVLKHALGYFLGLQKYYCKCSQKRNVKSPTPLELVGEGALYVAMGGVFGFIRPLYARVFVIGTLLHLIFDVLGLHKWFCRTHCIK